MKCNMCPKNCNVTRDKFIGNGFCNMGHYPKIARIAPHFDEEPIISGTKGSGAIFFCGCNLKCIYCQNYQISCQDTGRYIEPRELTAEIIRLETLGVHNIDFITGSHYVDIVKECLNYYTPKIPTIYNTSSYDKVEKIKDLNGYINVYLPDFKYSDDNLAKKYSNCDNYKETSLKAIEEMIKQVGKIELNEDGTIQKGVLIRHLVLPGHTKNSIDALKLIYDNFGNDIKISLMSQYMPSFKASSYDINRKITKREYEKVLNVVEELGFHGYMQELCSSDDKYIPNWDY